MSRRWRDPRRDPRRGDVLRDIGPRWCSESDRGVVITFSQPLAFWHESTRGDAVMHAVPARALTLYLSEETGAAHAAWWFLRQPTAAVAAACDAVIGAGAAAAACASGCGDDHDRETLRRACLHVAGIPDPAAHRGTLEAP